MRVYIVSFLIMLCTGTIRAQESYTEVVVENYYDNGKMESVGTLAKGIKHGKWVYFSESGKMERIGWYVWGIKDGKWIYFHENGRYKSEGDYQEGKKVGEWYFYDPEGDLERSQTIGTCTDPRDGQSYKTITYKDLNKNTSITWLAQNLNFKTKGALAYGHNEKNRERVGLLYNWNAAMKACPKGWHLPTKEEWNQLRNGFGGWEKSGLALKSERGWYSDYLKEGDSANGNNSSWFNVKPAGEFNFYEGEMTFEGKREKSYFWAASSWAENTAVVFEFWALWFKVSRYQAMDVKNGYSCRCVED